jgi:hypothetical protein
MRALVVLQIFMLFICLCCEKDKFDLGDCKGDDCIQASGYIYDRLTNEPLKSTTILITYRENCGWCGTGCLDREFEIGTVATNISGYFQTSFSSKEFEDITGTYVFEIAYDDFMEETVWITNDNQKDLFIESSLNPPAYLDLSISLKETENVEYFGLTIYPDSLSATPIGGYNSNRLGLFIDTTLIFKVPAERMVHFGYLIKTDIDDIYSDDSVFINRFKTLEYQINR